MQTSLKVLYHNEIVGVGGGGGGGRIEGECDKYPKNQVGSSPSGEIREGKMHKKGEEAATERGLGNIKRKKSEEEQKRENYPS